MTALLDVWKTWLETQFVMENVTLILVTGIKEIVIVLQVVKMVGQEMVSVKMFV